MKNVEINDNSLLKFPFTFNLDIPLPLEDLFHQSKHFTKEIEHLNYKIKFIKKSEKKQIFIFIIQIMNLYII